MNQVEEVWKHIPGLSAGYEVSNLGNVRLNFVDYAEPVKISKAKNGECIIYACSKQLRLHRVVAEAFLPLPDESSTTKWIVNHIDGNLENNVVSNLEWVSYSDSAKKSYHVGKLKGIRIYCRETDRIYSTIQTASACTQVPICAIEYGLQTGIRMYGFTFESVDEDIPYTEDMVLLTKQQIIELGKEFSSPDELRKI